MRTMDYIIVKDSTYNKKSYDILLLDGDDKTRRHSIGTFTFHLQRGATPEQMIVPINTILVGEYGLPAISLQQLQQIYTKDAYSIPLDWAQTYA